MREGDYAQVNVPSWADGGSPQHTGAFDVFQPVDDRSQTTDVWVDGELRASVPWQSATVFDLPEGESEWRVVNTAVHDGSYLAGVDEDGHRVDLPLERHGRPTTRRRRCR